MRFVAREGDPGNRKGDLLRTEMLIKRCDFFGREGVREGKDTFWAMNTKGNLACTQISKKQERFFGGEGAPRGKDNSLGLKDTFLEAKWTGGGLKGELKRRFVAHRKGELKEKGAIFWTEGGA